MEKPRTLIPTYSRPIMDPDNIDMNLSADITVGGVSFHLLSAFIFSLQVTPKFIFTIFKDITRSPSLQCTACSLSYNVTVAGQNLREEQRGIIQKQSLHPPPPPPPFPFLEIIRYCTRILN